MSNLCLGKNPRRDHASKMDADRFHYSRLEAKASHRLDLTLRAGGGRAFDHAEQNLSNRNVLCGIPRPDAACQPRHPKRLKLMRNSRQGPTGRKGNELDRQNSPLPIHSVLLRLPNRTALSTVRVGERLRIEYRSGPPDFAVVMTKDGRAAGAIPDALASQLIRHLARGIECHARVLSNFGLRCRVRVLMHKRDHG